MSYPAYTPPPFDPQAHQHAQDEDHLRLLSLFHYIVGGITALGSCIFLIHFFLGIAMLTNPDMLKGSNGHSDPIGDKFGGWLFTLMGGGAVLGGWTVGGLTAYAGKCIKERKSSLFVYIMSGLNCLSVPIGTALGVFTIVVLSRPTVKALFDGHVPAYATVPTSDPAQNGQNGQSPWYRG